ncbi:MAG: FAD-binding protein, partial [Syntrophales bacterium LBB04]|nr:FAD-binding protein [Syntrophales bacterium LBB04]
HHVKWDKEHPGRLFKWVGDEGTSGAGIIKPLEAYAKSKGVKILLEHKMTKIIRKGGTSGRVLGVEAQADGKKLFFRAKKGVILGSGGWKGNKFLRKLFDSRITEDIGTTGEPIVISDGSGLVAAMEAGAILASDRAYDMALYRRQFGTKNYLIPPNSPYGSRGIDVVGPRWGDVIFINKKGKRFVKEEDGFDFFNAALAQEDHVLWTICDDDAVKKNKWDMSHPNTQKGCAFSALTIAELANLIQVPGDSLSEAVEKYNTYVDAGKDPDFDKPKRLLRTKIEKPPFYAAWIQIFCHDTVGGLAINTRSQVLDIYGKVIPGLYAAGEAATGGFDQPGMPPALIFGRIAGENAAAESPA